MIKSMGDSLKCLVCGHIHFGAHRVLGPENAYGLQPVLCPKCKGESYEVIAARESK